MSSLTQLQSKIGYRFHALSLLERALTHRSISLNGSVPHMERLEFLGDAVLGLVISEWLHDAFSDHPEGELSRMRAALVRKESLYDVAVAWQLEPHLRVGASERSDDRHHVKSLSIVANAVEAVIGAVFKDGGWQPAQRLVLQAWQQKLQEIGTQDTRDAKSRLQELTQAKGWGLPEYRLTDRGAHVRVKRFEAHCFVRGELVGSGGGERKKAAECAAAEKAYRKLNHE